MALPGNRRILNRPQMPPEEQRAQHTLPPSLLPPLSSLPFPEGIQIGFFSWKHNFVCYRVESERLSIVVQVTLMCRWMQGKQLLVFVSCLIDSEEGVRGVGWGGGGRKGGIELAHCFCLMAFWLVRRTRLSTRLILFLFFMACDPSMLMERPGCQPAGALFRAEGKLNAVDARLRFPIPTTTRNPAPSTQPINSFHNFDQRKLKIEN